MQDISTGQLSPITSGEFHAGEASRTRNIVAVGDTFKVRGCYFRVHYIKPEGIVALGISRKEYFDTRRR